MTTVMALSPVLLAVTLRLNLTGLGALIAGLLILFFPRILNYVVAFYLIFVGVVQLLNLKL